MKFPGDSNHPPLPLLASIVPSGARNPCPSSNLQQSPGTSRNPPVRRSGAPNGRRSRHETLLETNGAGAGSDQLQQDEKPVSYFGWKRAAVSARKLAAELWRLQLPEVGDHGRSIAEDRLGLKHGIGRSNLYFLSHRNGVMHGDLKNLSLSPYAISRTKDRKLCELHHSLQFSSAAAKGITKWDPVSIETWDEAQYICNQVKLLDQKESAVSALEAELEQARVRIQELETERHSSKKKLEHFLKKVCKEKALWRSREHEKIRAYIDDIKAELSQERRSRQRIEIVNSKLVSELADAKLLAKRCMQEYEKERKEKDLIEEVCDELAKEIGEDKAEVEVLKRETMKLREEVEEEKRMLQMAEVWREERVQMKLIDAKVAVDAKYSQMNELVANLEIFLKSVNVNQNGTDIREASSLKNAAASMNIQDIKGFSYEPPNQNNVFSIFEDLSSGQPKEREIDPCVVHSPVSHASKILAASPKPNMISKVNFPRRLDASVHEIVDMQDDGSGWEIVSHVEDPGSICSPEGSIPSMTKNYRERNISERSGFDCKENTSEESPLTEISEVSSVLSKQSKKLSSIARFWRSGPTNADNYKIISAEGMNGSLSNGKLSNGSIMSPDWGSGKDGLSPQDPLCQLRSPDSGNSHNQGAEKNSLKARLLEARMESQKVRLRHVLKQKV
ncbi:uncharacterized protein LOC130963338 [Arachis stenosperma]|uniref:uncharacterized protein LOC130963338 n=1 Tax=Arachis stenosperma TaxID=217475 RepID=UPI0025AD6AE9|nr:uncharacterized protein LOC130963338 [Arachis stenosperma]